jgi:predicted transcriptional regulator
MRALSVRQPYADQIMRGTKQIEYRSRPTKIRGRIYIYASLTPAFSNGEDLPRGVIVGTVDLFNCTKGPRGYEWHLRNPKRFARPRKPVGKPQPVWFYPRS